MPKETVHLVDKFSDRITYCGRRIKRYSTMDRTTKKRDATCKQCKENYKRMK